MAALTRQAQTSQAKTQDTHAAVERAQLSSGSALEPGVRSQMEGLLGHDLRGVRVHSGEAAAQASEALNANAFTMNGDVYLNRPGFNWSNAQDRQLLAHELAHVVHARHATEHREGTAPPDARAETEADRFAHASTSNKSVRAPAPDFRAWGPAWRVHRQTKVTKKGTSVHSGEVGRAPGEVGVPTGSVDVRTGEEIEMKPGAKVPNMIAIAYTGPISASSKWLQFVWFELSAVTPKGTARVSGNVPTSSGTKPFTTNPASPSWSIDSASTSNPFYEAGFANIRDKSSTTVFDAPGGSSAAPLADAVFKAGIGATSVTFTAHFETYLIQNDFAVYLVEWQASTAFSHNKGVTTAAAIGYSLGGSTGQAGGLPADRKKMLDAAYPGFKHVQ